jgi:stage II sporulation protein AA (anti-sigma F factor antagonist)
LKIESSFKDGVLRLYFDGELDHHAAKKAMSAIEDKIDSVMPRNAVFDLKRLSFMDSSGIAIIVKTYKKMNRVGGAFAVENVAKQPMRVLDAAGLDRLIKISAYAKE